MQAPVLGPVLGADGKPLYAGLSVTPGGKKRGKKGGVEEGGKGKRRAKVTRNSEIVPAGRMVTISCLRCKDVPDMDRKGGDKNISDPYVIAAVVNESSGARLVSCLPTAPTRPTSPTRRSSTAWAAAAAASGSRGRPGNRRSSQVGQCAPPEHGRTTDTVEA